MQQISRQHDIESPATGEIRKILDRTALILDTQRCVALLYARQFDHGRRNVDPGDATRARRHQASRMETVTTACIEDRLAPDVAEQTVEGLAFDSGAQRRALATLIVAGNGVVGSHD